MRKTQKKVSILLFMLLVLSLCSFSFGQDLNSIGSTQPANTTTLQPVVTTAPPVNNSTTQSVQQAPENTVTQQAPVNTNTTENVPVDTTLQDQQNGAAAVGEMFKQAGVNEEAVKKANEKLRPIAEFMNFVNAIIVGLVAIFLFTVTALDLAYIALPILRPFLDGGQGMAQAGGGDMSGGMGMGGMGMGGYGSRRGMMGGMGGMMGGGGAQPQQQAGHRWVSDEALAAVMAMSPQPQAGGMGMGGMMGGMGGMMGGMGAAPAPQPMGSVIMSYMKKRSFFLIAFGVCVVIFTTSVFTDLGVKIGMVMLSWLSSINM